MLSELLVYECVINMVVVVFKFCMWNEWDVFFVVEYLVEGL